MGRRCLLSSHWHGCRQQRRFSHFGVATVVSLTATWRWQRSVATQSNLPGHFAKGGSKNKKSIATSKCTASQSAATESRPQVQHDIWSLALPALGALCLDPLMSLVDTVCI